MEEQGARNKEQARLSRRQFLRSAAFGGAGLAGAYLLGCGDDAGAPSATSTAPAEASPTFAGVATETAGAMRWQRLEPAGPAPSPRFDHSLVTDGASLYLFGGRNPQPLADLWRYDIAANAWAEVISGSIPPEFRFGHNAVWDPAQSRMIIFGGQAGGDFWNNVYQFDVAANAWQRIAPPTAGVGPSARYGAAGALDANGNMLITHGFTNEGRFDDTWQFDLAAREWAEVSPPAEDRPLRRCLIRGVWDTHKSRMLIYGGQSNEAAFMDDLWAWYPELDEWQEITRTPRPSPRNLYAMVYDEALREAILIGGRTEDGPMIDVWIFHSDGENWTVAAPEGEAPAPRYGHDAVITAEGRIFVFGGTGAGDGFNDLWELIRVG